jgi:hypothetical protein
MAREACHLVPAVRVIDVCAMSDVWSQFAAITPTGAPRHLAYVDGPAVGFDLRMPLPARCLTCGSEDHLAPERARIRIKGGLDVFLAHHLRGDRVDGLIQVGDRVELSLPFCATCRAMQKRVMRLTWLVRLAPLWMVAVMVAFALISSSLAIVGVLAAVVGLIAAYIERGRLDARYVVEIESIDGDGIVRMAPVHPDASHAIMVAAGMERA